MGNKNDRHSDCNNWDIDEGYVVWKYLINGPVCIQISVSPGLVEWRIFGREPNTNYPNKSRLTLLINTSPIGLDRNFHLHLSQKKEQKKTLLGPDVQHKNMTKEQRGLVCFLSLSTMGEQPTYSTNKRTNERTKERWQIMGGMMEEGTIGTVGQRQRETLRVFANSPSDFSCNMDPTEHLMNLLLSRVWPNLRKENLHYN